MSVKTSGDFSVILERELLRAERAKATAVAVVVCVVVIIQLTLFTLGQDAFALLSDKAHLRWWIVACSAPLLIWELIVRRWIGQALETGRRVPRALGWVSACLEVSLPTATLVVSAAFIGPVAALVAPPLVVYGLFIALTALRLDPRVSVFAGGVACVGYLAVAAALIPPGLAFDSHPMPYLMRGVSLFATGGATAVVASQLRRRITDSVQAWQERAYVVNVFGRYLTDDVVDVLLSSPEGVQLGGEKRELTLMMTDLRGFSAHSEKLPPERVVALLNHYLGAMTEVIEANEGTIDEFIGDAILVVFGAPVAQPDHAARALRCAIEMQRAMGAVNEWNRAQGLPEVEMGIGVHSGQVVVGNIGSERRKKYGVVGSEVNLTSRIESYTVGGQVLASMRTIEAAENVSWRGAREVHPKGASQPFSIAEVTAVGDVALPEQEDALLDVTPVEVDVRVMAGKDLGAVVHRGALVRVSLREAVLRCEVALQPMDNVVLSIAGGEAFAKVMGVDGLAHLRFTARDEAATRALDAARATAAAS